jgi:hypothetical protein
MLTWQHSGFSVDTSVRISLADRDVPGYFQSLEHLLRYCTGPAFALDRLSVVPGTVHRPERIRYTLPRHKRGNWVGPGRRRKPTRPGAGGVIELTPFEFLDRLAALIPPPRRHRHRYHGVFAPNHPLRQAVTALSGISASNGSGKPRRASMPVSRLPRVETAAVRREPLMESRAIMTRRGLPGRSCWHGWVRSFR